MALKRRKILEQMIHLGYGEETVPSDSGGTQTGNKVGIHSFMGGNFLNASDQDGDSGDEKIASALTIISGLGGGTVYMSAGGGIQTWTSAGSQQRT